MRSFGIVLAPTANPELATTFANLFSLTPSVMRPISWKIKAESSLERKKPVSAHT